jgi:hypothetical protein
MPTESKYFVRRAWPAGSEFFADEHQILWNSLGSCLNDFDLKRARSLIDPLLVGHNLSDENGFRVSRRLRRGELRKVVQQRREEAFNAGHGPDGQPDPTLSPRMREVFVRQRERAAKQLQDPLPAEDELPKSYDRWPVGKRFVVTLDMDAHESCAPFLNPKETTVYYDAVTFERFVVKVLDVLVKDLPDMQPQVDRIRADLRWWVEHDAAHVPGVDDS